MSAIRSHLAKHGVIHLLWIITILVMVVASLLVFRSDEEDIIKLISFASAITSIVLALVAIFYAIISNQAFSESSSKLNSSAEKILGATDALDRNIQEYRDESKSLASAVQAVPESVELLRDHVTERLELAAKTDASQTQKTGEGVFGDINHAVAAALYVLYLSYKHDKEFKTDNVFDLQFLDGTLNGVGVLLTYCHIDGIEVRRIGSVFQCRSIGTSRPEDFEAVYNRIPDSLREELEKARQYFGEEPSEDLNSEIDESA